jgi:L,D-peptidoglycan transpeptidase YkuD (ErfK/YbiS/YcfS/YnhG family)
VAHGHNVAASGWVAVRDDARWPKLALRTCAGAVSAVVAAAVAVTVVAVTAVAPATAAQRPVSKAFQIPVATRQLIVGTTPGADSSVVELQRWSRTRGGSWKPVGSPFAGRLGARGVAWGRGIHPFDPLPVGLVAKREGDDRSPAGVFTLGMAFGFAPVVQHQSTQPYTQVTPYDLFIEDPNSPAYNTHVRIDHLPATEWEITQQMEQSDPSHALELVINHNTAPSPLPGAGSAILFHVWRRDGAANTSGCTSMAWENVRDLVAWVDPRQRPLYVLLPREMYLRVAPGWRLPALPPVTVTSPVSSVRAPAA